VEKVGRAQWKLKRRDDKASPLDDNGRDRLGLGGGNRALAETAAIIVQGDRRGVAMAAVSGEHRHRTPSDVK